LRTRARTGIISPRRLLYGRFCELRNSTRVGFGDVPPVARPKRRRARARPRPPCPRGGRGHPPPARRSSERPPRAGAPQGDGHGAVNDLTPSSGGAAEPVVVLATDACRTTRTRP